MSDAQYNIKWSNITKPTPANVARWLRMSRRITVSIGTLSWVAHYPDIPPILALVQLTLEEFAGYIGEVAKENSVAKMSLSGPQEAMDQIEVTTTTEEHPKKSQG